MLIEWINAITAPRITFQEEKTNATIIKGIKSYAYFVIIVGVLLLLFVVYNGLVAIFSSKSSISSIIVAIIAGVINLFLSFMIIFNLILMFVFFIIGSFVVVAITYLIAKALKGKGTFATQYYLTSLIVPPISFISGFISLFYFIPFIGPLITFIFSLLLSIFAAYLIIVMLDETHGFGMGKSILTFLIVLLLYGVLLLIIIFLIISRGGINFLKFFGHLFFMAIFGGV